MEIRKSNSVNSFFSFRFRINPGLIVEMISGLFFLLFLYAAASKLLDYDRFKAQIGVSPLLTAVAGLTAILVPMMELVFVVLLIIPKTRLLALYGSFTLMLMFTFYIIAILNFSEHIPCSCGGIFEKMRWKEHFFFNLFFVILAIVGIVLQSKLNKNKANQS